MQQYAPAPHYFPGATPYYVPDGGFPTHPPPGWGMPPQNMGVPFPSPTYGGFPGPSPHQGPVPQQPPLQRAKHSTRISTAQREARDTRTAVPLKSAMKKGSSQNGHRPSTPGHSPGPRPTTPRSRSSSSARDGRLPLGAMTRQRTNSGSSPHFIPNHIMVSFHGSNELRFEGIAYEDTADALRERVLPMWPVDDEGIKGHRWRVVFRDSPWNCTGHDLIMARRVVAALFTSLARLGYFYQTTVNSGKRLPRLVFVEPPERKLRTDGPIHFFSVMFSRKGEKVTILDAPEPIKDSIGVALRNTFPRRVASDKILEDGMCVIELQKNVMGAPPVDKSMFVSAVLKHLQGHGYDLNASVPLARRGPLGLGGRKELWIFKRRQPES
ncbi:hypothetical protein OE88DRAFT_1650672 [Heliocybe sulcata]|uniref:Uncharacterized protein n=1 Tax=Heliocybe sulcata TaxID=5364 RepID=A0A5C3NJQ3_9AGAM|nr:hypothetical protein OE88DRAFT_1650672 [Heliocybe sulcata]